jgi:hypothetical protein
LQQEGGELIASLDINYSHTGGIDWRTSDYKTYTRIYTPKGSELLSLNKLNNSADPGDEVQVRTEYGKTVFGSYIKISAGENGGFRLRYKLPERISERVRDDGYELYWQKQPGNNIEKIVVDVGLKNGVKSYNPVGFYADKMNESRVRWSGEMREDRQFELKVKN